jgi:hypothetical protein
MIIILNDARIEKSREFVKNYGEGYEIIDWSSADDINKISALKYFGNFTISDFPSVFDTGNGRICRTPDDMESAILELEGLDTLESALQTRYNEVTAKTEELITAGIEYQNVVFHCDLIAQQNFTVLFMQKNELSYPYEIWDGNNSVQIQDADEMSDFCLQVMAFVEASRQNGKVLRDSLASMTLEELRNFSDSR